VCVGGMSPDVEVFFPWQDGSTRERTKRMLAWLDQREFRGVPAWRVLLCPLSGSMALWDVSFRRAK